MRGIFILLALAPSLAHADFFRCSFNGDLYRAEFETNGDRIDIWKGSRPAYQNEASFKLIGPGSFEVWSNDRFPVVRLLLNNLGFDGKNSFAYPYQAELRLPGQSKMLGGCYSDYVPLPEKEVAPLPEPKPDPAPAPEIPEAPPAPEQPAPAPANPSAPKPGRVTPVED